MKTRKISGIALIAVLMICVSVPADDKPEIEVGIGITVQDSAGVMLDTTVVADSLEKADKIVAYYFHGTRRCATCKKIEAYSKEAIEGKFATELASGRMEFYPINFDEEENRHFIKDYGLYTKSLVICDYKNGEQVRWKNLEKVWDYVRDHDEFLKYVQDEISAYLGEK